MLSGLWYLGLATTGVTALARRLSGGALVLGYHNVVPRSAIPYGDPLMHMRTERFAAQMNWLTIHYDIISLSQLVDRLGRGASCARTAVLTFDDAYHGVFQEAAPVLRALGLPATVFAMSDAGEFMPAFWWDHPVASHAARDRDRLLFHLRGDQHAILPEERFPAHLVPPRPYQPASWDTIRAADEFEIGSHSRSHRTLTQLDDRELALEVTRSREEISAQTGREPQWFAYPYGVWDARVRAAVAAAGYRGAVALDPGLNTASTDRFALRRVNVPASISLPVLGGWAAGLGPHPRPQQAA